MTYLVTDIEFDFNDSLSEEYQLTLDEQSQIIQDSIGCWEAEDEDDLIEEITTATGWCIKNINYEVQLLTCPKSYSSHTQLQPTVNWMQR